MATPRDTKLKGKVYADYLADEEKLNGPRRRARMKAAIDAMKARKKAGIDITIREKKNFSLQVANKLRQRERTAL